MGARCRLQSRHQRCRQAPSDREPDLRVAAIVGPTASGKSALALGVACRYHGEIVSVDSMQVYREMDVGTAKPSDEDRRAVPHHLVDVADPGEEYSVARFQREGRAVLADLEARSTPAIVCGGSGLHFRALVDPLDFPPTDPGTRAELEAAAPEALVDELLRIDPGAEEHVDLANPRRVLRAVEIHRLTGETPSLRSSADGADDIRSYRPVIDFAGIGVDPGEALADRIEARLDRMLAGGWPEEAAALDGRLGPTARGALGYRELAAVSRGEMTLQEAREEILRATMAFARRQRTFLRRDPRITWLPWHDEGGARLAAAAGLLEEAGWTS